MVYRTGPRSGSQRWCYQAIVGLTARPVSDRNQVRTSHWCLRQTGQCVLRSLSGKAFRRASVSGVNYYVDSNKSFVISCLTVVAFGCLVLLNVVGTGWECTLLLKSLDCSQTGLTAHISSLLFSHLGSASVA